MLIVLAREVVSAIALVFNSPANLLFLYSRLGKSVTTQSGSGRQYVGSGRQFVTGS